MKIQLLLSLLSFAQISSAVVTQGHQMLVSGPSPMAVEVAQAISKKGGNAVDIAVAVALSLSVTHPYYAALGGGGFALIKVGKEIKALDFREVAPKATNQEFYKGLSEHASIDGALAVAVPGYLAGLWELHQKYGKLHWSLLFPEVIALAVKGFAVSGEWHENTQEVAARFNAAGKRIFLRGTVAPLPGDIFKQPELAKLLKEIANRGTLPLYEGLGARDIVDTIQAAGGKITLDDLRNYKPRWLVPLHLSYHGYDIWSMPPPSSGGIISQIALSLLDLFKVADARSLSVDEFHRLAEALKLAFRIRSQLGDPAFTKNPLANLLDPTSLNNSAKLYSANKSIEPDSLPPLQLEHSQTTHLSVVTANGDAVAMTVTLNGDYGSAVVTEKYGVALNNEMDDFATHLDKPNMFGLMQGKENAVEPGKRPLSSMTPTLVTKDGQLQLAIGAPGGPRIISAVTQVLYRVLFGKMDLDLAIQAPRLHHQFSPNIVYTDADRFSPEILDQLKAKGHKIENGWQARVFAVQRGENGLLRGAFDSRGEGACGGL